MPAAATSDQGKHAPSVLTSTPPTSKDEDQADLSAINTTLDRMRTFTPPDPYILTIPQDVEPRYHHAYQYQATQWLHLAPFQWREGEGLQYQSFVWHEHGKDMYVLHNSRGKDEMEVGGVRKDKAKGGLVGGGGTPGGVVVKKKISLDAYKKKQTPGGTPAAAQEVAKAVTAVAKPVDAPPAKKPAVKGPVERVRAETEEVLAAVADEVVEQPPAQVFLETEKKLKRKREETERHDEKLLEVPASSEEPATKRARTSPSIPRPATAKPSETQASQTEQPTKSPQKPSTPLPADPEETALPPKLSPLEVPSMPSRLSPTIPANMAATLKSREHLRSSSSDSSAPSSSSKNGKLTPGAKKSDGITKHKSPIPRNAFRANSSSPAVRSSDTEEKVRRAPATSAPQQRAKSPELGLEREDEVAVGRALKAKKQQSPEKPERVEKPSLIVKLKYKKQQRDDIRRILNMRPRSKNSGTPQVAATTSAKVADEPKVKAADEPTAEKVTVRRRDPNAKGVAKKVGPPTRNEVAKKKVAEAKAPQAEKRLPPPSQEGRVPAPKPVQTPSVDTSAPTTGEDVETALSQPAKRKADAEATNGERLDGPVKRKAAVEATNAENRISPAKRKAAPEATASGVEEPPAKRKKVPDAIDIKKAPSTPAQPDLLSPALLSSKQKSQQVTPNIRKDHLSVAMQRELSTDSNVNTPSAKSNTTPLTNGNAHNTSQPNGVTTNPPSSSQASAVKTPKQQIWENEQKRLETLGRELKHAATAHLKTLTITSSSDPSTEQKLAAVKSLESLLAYILAFTCADEAALAADPKQNPSIKTWRSLHGFFAFVKRNCEGLPLLGGVACWLGVVFNARILEILGLYPAERPARDITMEVYATLTKNASDAEEKLDVDALLENFPRTWKGRVKGPLGTDKLIGPADFAGEYKVPIGVQTPPLRAARAGYAMLEEWIRKEKVDYEMQLKL